jgi:hypothetical protein
MIFVEKVVGLMSTSQFFFHFNLSYQKHVRCTRNKYRYEEDESTEK